MSPPIRPPLKHTAEEQKLAKKIINLLRREGYLPGARGIDTDAQEDIIYEYLARKYGFGYRLLSTNCKILENGSAQIIRDVTIEAHSYVAEVDTFISIPEDDPSGNPRDIIEGKIITSDEYDLHLVTLDRQPHRVHAKIEINPALEDGDELTYRVLDSNLSAGVYSIGQTQEQVDARENPWDYWGWQTTRPTASLVLKVDFPFGWKPTQIELVSRYAIAPGIANDKVLPLEKTGFHDPKVHYEETGDSISVAIDYPLFNFIYMLRWKPKVRETSRRRSPARPG
jgi:hypothetical protein